MYDERSQHWWYYSLLQRHELISINLHTTRHAYFTPIMLFAAASLHHTSTSGQLFKRVCCSSVSFLTITSCSIEILYIAIIIIITSSHRRRFVKRSTQCDLLSACERPVDSTSVTVTVTVTVHDNNNNNNSRISIPPSVVTSEAVVSDGHWCHAVDTSSCQSVSNKFLINHHL